MKRKLRGCPIYCKYCGARLKRDPVGHYCPSKNCDWQFGVKGCNQPALEVAASEKEGK